MGHDGKPCPNAKATSSVIFGDVNGLFPLQVGWCGCGETASDKENARWKQLVRMGYVPASFSNPQTAFSTNLFERMHLELMEGHASMKSVWEVLRRQTQPNFPELTDNRYVELMRVYRWHRDLVWIVEGGGYHEPRLRYVPGGLALFCTCCPQPGINVFDAKPGDPLWLYHIYVTMDGNFKMEQLFPKNVEADVRLRDDQGFLVGMDNYMEFLNRTKDWRSTCNAFYNQDHADVPVDHLMWRGLVSLACARHGSEVCDAVKIRSVTIIYDIMCQYKLKLHERLARGGLTEPKDIELTYFIGKFHLGGHKEDCWAAYTLDLLLGGGRQDGEVLETLWSGLNKSKSTVRAMAGAFRQEFLDDLIQDSNWKKLIGGGMFLFHIFSENSRPR
ncbi:hypothetical protein K435DRAFT_665593 [Dendrothele bispora CBS 962.96]|uniref:CxC2-like cysteine cluster KDZ transposase-associated domain-containing protein n=1 Tax=Dendrothele bispora (strain CBS 962.96) TaxID=1314807 RepID=A0A4S8M148_DENBC|nr:hypothetical protein K435DRAFT_665593 [Dendrothele bispora CBS 962.96]